MRFFLLGFILLACFWGLFEWLRDNTHLPSLNVTEHRVSLPVIIIPSLIPMALSEVNAILDRPVFFADRQLPRRTVLVETLNTQRSTPTLKAAPPYIRLTAIVSDTFGVRLALLVSDKGVDHALAVGDMFEGWRLSEIGVDSVTFKANAISHVVKLYDVSNKPVVKHNHAWRIR